ncbi:polyketide synthase dehydratase domain-containing protein [Streptomyces sp. S1A(2023)]
MIGDHLVRGRAVVAGVVHLALAREAAAPRNLGASVVFEDVRWRVPLEVEDDTLDVSVGFGEEGSSYEIRAAGSGTVHSTGTLTAGTGRPLGRIDTDAVRARCARRSGAEEVYGNAEAAGLRYGPLFRGLTALHRGDGEALAELARPAAEAPDWAVEAAMADSALHAVQGVLPEGESRTALPASVARITVNGRAQEARYAYVRLVSLDSVRGTARADVDLADADGTVLVRFEGLRIARPSSPDANLPERPERTERTERTEHTEHTEHTERTEQTDCTEHTEQSVPLYRPVWRPRAAGGPGAGRGGAGPRPGHRPRPRSGRRPGRPPSRGRTPGPSRTPQGHHPRRRGVRGAPAGRPAAHRGVVPGRRRGAALLGRRPAAARSGARRGAGGAVPPAQGTGRAAPPRRRAAARGHIGGPADRRGPRGPQPLRRRPSGARRLGLA